MKGIAPVIINETGLTLDEVKQLRQMGFEVAEQGSEAWLEERLGLATASRFFDIVDWTKETKNVKAKPKAAYYSYMFQLLAERRTGKVARFSSKPMEWGRQHEEQAASLYAEMTGADVRELGFIKHDTLDAGASLDRTVDDDGLLEIKCPNTSTHLSYIFNGIPPQYHAQMQGQMWIAGKQWGDFMSFDPEVDGPDQVYIERIERNDEFINVMEQRITQFLAALDRKEEQLREYIR